jgi:hypothetical protein
MAQLSATPANLMFDSPNADLQVTTLNYEPAPRGSARRIMMASTDGTNWINIDISDNSGRVESPPIFVGQVLTVNLYESRGQKIDPRKPTPETSPLASIAILGLLQGPHDPGWDADGRGMWGGTYYQRVAYSPPDFTCAVLQISLHRPETDVLARLGSTNTIKLYQGFFTYHSFDSSSPTPPEPAVGLLPGTTYFATLVLMDSKGQWTYKIEEFTTLRRKVVVSLTMIKVINDGDGSALDNDPGEAKFRVSLFEGSTNSMPNWGQHMRDRMEVSPTFWLGDDQYKVWSVRKPGRGPIMLSHQWEVGPRTIRPETQCMELETGGTEFDPPFASEIAGDVAGSEAIVALDFPIGPYEAKFGTLSVTATPSRAGDTFIYTVEAFYTVTYQV